MHLVIKYIVVESGIKDSFFFVRCLLCFPLGFGVRVRFLGMNVCLKAGVRVMVRFKVCGYAYN